MMRASSGLALRVRKPDGPNREDLGGLSELRLNDRRSSRNDTICVWVFQSVSSRTLDLSHLQGRPSSKINRYVYVLVNWHIGFTRLKNWPSTNQNNTLADKIVAGPSSPADSTRPLRLHKSILSLQCILLFATWLLESFIKGGSA